MTPSVSEPGAGERVFDISSPFFLPSGVAPMRLPKSMNRRELCPPATKRPPRELGMLFAWRAKWWAMSWPSAASIFFARPGERRASTSLARCGRIFHSGWPRWNDHGAKAGNQSCGETPIAVRSHPKANILAFVVSHGSSPRAATISRQPARTPSVTSPVPAFVTSARHLRFRYSRSFVNVSPAAANAERQSTNQMARLRAALFRRWR